MFMHSQVSLPFPGEGLVYDYRLDDGGISRMGKSEDEEEDVKKSFKVYTTNVAVLYCSCGFVVSTH